MSLGSFRKLGNIKGVGFLGNFPLALFSDGEAWSAVFYGKFLKIPGPVA